MCCPPPPRPPRCPTRVGSLTHHVRNCVYTHCWMPHATWERREGGQPRVVACCVGGCGGWPPLLDILNSVATPPCHPSPPPLSPLPTHGLHFVWNNNTIVSWGPCQHALASSSSQGQGEPGVLPCGRVGVRNPPPHTVARRTLAPRAPWTQAPPCAPVHMIAFLTVCTAKGWVAWPSHGPPPRKWHTQVTTNPNAQLCARPTHGGPHARLWRHCTPTPEPQAPYHLGNRTPIHSRLPPAGLRPSLTTLYTVYTPRLAPLLPQTHPPPPTHQSPLPQPSFSRAPRFRGPTHLITTEPVLAHFSPPAGLCGFGCVC
jgi:hypothetical protein